MPAFTSTAAIATPVNSPGAAAWIELMKSIRKWMTSSGQMVQVARATAPNPTPTPNVMITCAGQTLQAEES